MTLDFDAIFFVKAPTWWSSTSELVRRSVVLLTEITARAEVCYFSSKSEDLKVFCSKAIRTNTCKSTYIHHDRLVQKKVKLSLQFQRYAVSHWLQECVSFYANDRTSFLDGLICATVDTENIIQTSECLSSNVDWPNPNESNLIVLERNDSTADVNKVRISCVANETKNLTVRVVNFQT